MRLRADRTPPGGAGIAGSMRALLRTSRGLPIAALLLGLLLAGCRAPLPARSAPPGTAGPAPPGTPGPAPELGAGAPALPPGQATHPLTGLPVPEQGIRRRVLLVTVDNNPRARPQYGLAAADLVYELPVEGGITRFVALYLVGESEQIGPVRSARDYMLDLVLEWDAVWVHAGESPQHRERRSGLRVDRLDDLEGVHGGGVFWRGKDRRPPHNLYTDTRRLRAKVAELGWEREPPRREPFRFAPTGPQGAASAGDAPASPAGGRAADVARAALEAAIALPGALREVVTYVYDPLTDAYRRYTRGRADRDARTGEQLAVANVLLQFTRAAPIPGDPEGRLEVALVGEGPLQALSGGRLLEGRWRKERPEAPTRYLDAGGVPLTLRPGPTWILVLPEGTRVEVRGE